MVAGNCIFAYQAQETTETGDFGSNPHFSECCMQVSRETNDSSFVMSQTSLELDDNSMEHIITTNKKIQSPETPTKPECTQRQVLTALPRLFALE